MPMLPSPSRRPSLAGYLLGLALVAALSGCAFKNPFGSASSADKPAAPASTPAPGTATPSPAHASTAMTDGANVPAPTGTRRWLGVFSPFKIDIQQGNFVSQEMIARLKEGMTKEQVRFVLGVPLLTDMFHADRWDYLFRLQKANGQFTANRVTIFFKENRVTRFEHTPLPDEAEYISHISGTPPAPAKDKAATPPAKPESSKQP